MNNRTIAKIFQKTAQLLELHDANVFKVRSYQNAAINLEKLSEYIGQLPQTNWSEIQGLGKNLVDKIASIIDHGSFDELDQLLIDTPQGVQKMLDIKGIGPKKIRSLWIDHAIDSKEKLISACENGQLADWKGFGEKTQKSILENLAYEAAQSGKVFYAEAESIAKHLLSILKSKGINDIEICGQTAQFEETVSHLEFLGIDAAALLDALKAEADFEYNPKISGPNSIRGVWMPKDLNITFHISTKEQFGNDLLLLSAYPAHLKTKIKNDTSLLHILTEGKFSDVESIYKKVELPYIPAELRGGGFEFNYAKEGKLETLIKDEDLKGTLHNHSTYSDGKNSLREMAEKAQNMGLDYLGISDHSKSAFYANGLDEDRILQQHEEIDVLNKEMAPFRIFKGIESDILNDGNLDYEKGVLASFDFIVSSIHSSLNMDMRKATARLIKAIENPYTTILGHPTGRLLLRRKGYPIDHKMIIDACAANNVIIEINANPWRLDMSWEYVQYALEKNVMISINPDAHEVDGYEDMHYGVCVGRKGGLTKEMTFNALNTEAVAKYFENRLKS